jgi:hypothetical protein
MSIESHNLISTHGYSPICLGLSDNYFW